MSKKPNFTWKIGAPLPKIEAHTERKLEVIDQYLDIYFDTVTANRRMEVLRITIVDGFCGGGSYQKGKETIFGSPMVLLHAVERARLRVNATRHKPLAIDARFYFSDTNRLHIAALREEIKKSPFSPWLDDTVSLRVGDFETLLPSILKDIRNRQRQGRSFFVLDQWGYLNVPVQSLRAIFSNLEKPEALLTFSIDALLNYIRNDGTGIDKLRQFGVSEEFAGMWTELKDDDNLGRATAQRLIMEELRIGSGAEFFTPFMMFSKTDSRWMLFAHLSKHQTARDKMLEVHWRKQNHFRHIGKGSLFEMGFDYRLIESRDALFSFQESDEELLMKELENELPTILRDSIRDSACSMSNLLNGIGNRTAARNSMIFETIRKIARAGDIEVIGENGKVKGRGTLIKPSDMLVRPPQKSFSFHFPQAS